MEPVVRRKLAKIAKTPALADAVRGKDMASVVHSSSREEFAPSTL